MISVDGGDTESATMCRPFTDHPRFEMVVHDRQLGWAGNYNWLVRRSDLPFFCFWQQDDLADPDYLERLRVEMLTHGDTSVAFADLQWFGSRSDLDSTPSILGSRLERVHTLVERLRHEPMHGMIRVSLLDRDRDALAITPDSSCQEEFVLLARLAAGGPLRRVEGARYRKRAHPGNEYQRFMNFPEYRRRRGWLTMGAGLVDVLLEVAPRRHRQTVLALVAERLAVHKPGRDYFYLPAPTDEEISRLVRELFMFTDVEPEPVRSPLLDPITGDPIHDAVVAGLRTASMDATRRREMAATIRHSGGGAWSTWPGGDGEALLGRGWSTQHGAEGRWSDADEATVRLPPLSAGEWTVAISGVPYGPEGSEPRVGWSNGNGESHFTDLEAHQPATVEGAIDITSAREPTVTLSFPDAASPRSLGISDDPRKLGFLLQRVSISRR
jgi:hypothetical protein